MMRIELQKLRSAPRGQSNRFGLVLRYLAESCKRFRALRSSLSPKLSSSMLTMVESVQECGHLETQKGDKRKAGPLAGPREIAKH